MTEAMEANSRDPMEMTKREFIDARPEFRSYFGEEDTPQARLLMAFDTLFRLWLFIGGTEGELPEHIRQLLLDQVLQAKFCLQEETEEDKRFLEELLPEPGSPLE